MAVTALHNVVDRCDPSSFVIQIQFLISSVCFVSLDFVFSVTQLIEVLQKVAFSSF